MDYGTFIIFINVALYFSAMDIKIHIITSTILAALLYNFYGLWVLLVVIVGTILDIDHFIYFYRKKRKLSLRECYAYYKHIDRHKKFAEIKDAIFIFHLVELLILFLIAGFFNRLFLLIFYSMLLHYILDIIYEAKYLGGIVKPYSIIYWLVKRKE